MHSDDSSDTRGHAVDTREPPRGEPGLSWIAMLAWIAVAFAVAGVVAFFLVRPFFAHR